MSDEHRADRHRAGCPSSPSRRPLLLDLADGATLVSLTGNITHALLTAPAGVAVARSSGRGRPATVLLCAVHGIAVLAKTNASGAMYRASVTATAALAVGAFFLSFVALRDLAVLAGIAPSLALVLPLVINVAVAVATTALVAVGDKPARRTRPATQNATAPAPRSATPSTVGTTRSRAVLAHAESVSAVSTAPALAGAATAQLAADLVAAKVTRQPIGGLKAEGLHEVLRPSSARCTAAWQSRRLDGHVARSSQHR